MTVVTLRTTSVTQTDA